MVQWLQPGIIEKKEGLCGKGFPFIYFERLLVGLIGSGTGNTQLAIIAFNIMYRFLLACCAGSSSFKAIAGQYGYMPAQVAFGGGIGSSYGFSFFFALRYGGAR
jgi:hypothetical protein